MAPTRRDEPPKVASPPKTTKSPIRKRRRSCGNSKTTLQGSSVQDSSNPFPFLQLPAELRNMIYELSLVDLENTIFIKGCASGSIGRKLRRKSDLSPAEREMFKRKLSSKRRAWGPLINFALCPQLLKVCKQINAEASSFMYANNHFELENTTVMNTFLDQCGAQIKHIRRISLSHWPKKGASEQRHAFQHLSNAVNLEAFILEYNCLEALNPGRWIVFASTWEAICAANRFFDKAGNWMWNRAVKAGGKEAALDLLFFPDSFPGRFKGRTQRQFSPYEDPSDRNADYEKAFREEIKRLMR